MRGVIDKAYETPTAGGTAFLEELRAACGQAPIRLTLIGHSMGSIYVQRFIEALQQIDVNPENLTVEVIFLAAAIPFDRMYAGLDSFRTTVREMRAFALNDKRESGYWEIKPIYNRSLLYIVSSLCENDPWADKPIVGMQRFWSGPQFGHLADVVNVRQFIDDRTVWSPAVGKKKTTDSSWRCNAKRHGSTIQNGQQIGFPAELLTLQSIDLIIQHGFGSPVGH